MRETQTHASTIDPFHLAPNLIRDFNIPHEGNFAQWHSFILSIHVVWATHMWKNKCKKNPLFEIQLFGLKYPDFVHGKKANEWEIELLHQEWQWDVDTLHWSAHKNDGIFKTKLEDKKKKRKPNLFQLPSILAQAYL